MVPDSKEGFVWGAKPGRCVLQLGTRARHQLVTLRQCTNRTLFFTLLSTSMALDHWFPTFLIQLLMLR